MERDNQQLGAALIVGLGNPGAAYARTRHNAGADFVLALAATLGTELKKEARFDALTARVSVEGRDVRLLVPQSFMNLSGRAVAAMANFFRIDPSRMLVAHDELDLEAGNVRFKLGGGHGGHNGLRDILAALGNQAGFYRLRIGIGHPGAAALVSAYVLSKPSPEDRIRIDRCIEEAIAVLPEAIRGNWPAAMTRLNGFKA